MLLFRSSFFPLWLYCCRVLLSTLLTHLVSGSLESSSWWMSRCRSLYRFLWSFLLRRLRVPHLYIQRVLTTTLLLDRSQLFLCAVDEATLVDMLHLVCWNWYRSESPFRVVHRLWITGHFDRCRKTATVSNCHDRIFRNFRLGLMVVPSCRYVVLGSIWDRRQIVLLTTAATSLHLLGTL